MEKVEIVLCKDREKYIVYAKTLSGSKTINTRTISLSSIWGKGTPFVNIWTMSEEELVTYIEAIKGDMKYLSKIGETGVIEIGGPAAVGTPLQKTYVFGDQKTAQELIDTPLITVVHNGKVFSVTKMKQISGKPLTKTEIQEIINQFRNMLRASLFFKKREVSVKKFRSLPTNTTYDYYKKFSELTLGEQLLKRISAVTESIQLSSIELLINNTPKLYLSTPLKKYYVVDPTTNTYDAIVSLVNEGISVDAVPMQMWTQEGKIKVTENSIITVKGLVTASSADNHVFMLSMYSKEGSKTSKITDRFYNMLRKWGGISRKEIGKVLSTSTGSPETKIHEAYVELTEVFKRIYTNEDYIDARKQYEFLPEDYKAPFSLYMIDKETLPILVINAYSSRWRGMKSIAIELQRILSI